MVQVKICGLKDKQAIQCAVDSGADYLGFIFFPPSPRYVVPEECESLAEDITRTVKKVAVVVDAEDDLLSDIIDYLDPDYLQLHGNESLERVQYLKTTFAVPLIKAITVKSAQDLENTKKYEDFVEMFLFDAKAPEGADLPGGNGIAFDWKLLSEIKITKPWMLSGGLNSANVQEAIEQTNAKIVDVSSGVESSKGVKDLQRIEEFIKTVKNI